MPKAWASRLLDPALVPESLYDARRKRLLLPAALRKAYLEVLRRRGLTDLAKSRRSDSSPVGGISLEETNEHFAKAFDGSVARSQLAILDPGRDVTAAANAFIETLSGNKVCIVDAPCGAGAASLSFLSTIAQLRAEGVLPRLPLDICLVGGEISSPARAITMELLETLTPALEEQAIFVTPVLMHWDVLNPLSNTDLIRKMTENSMRPTRRLLVVANFSGFLGAPSQRMKKAMPQIDELFRHISGRGALAVWIEPKMNVVTGAGGVFDLLLRGFRWLLKKPESETITSESDFVPAFGDVAKVRLAVLRFDLERA